MKLSGSDRAVSAAVLLGAAGLFSLFLMDINAVSIRIGEKELGTVVFKKLTATRKAPSGLGWERMQNNSPVYNADTLRTAGFSEAAVYFDDGTSLDMLENTMLKLNFGGKAKGLEFLEGEISLTGSREGASYDISSAAGSIKLGKDSKATFSREAGTLSVEVTQGSASIVKADGSSQAIAQNQELQIDVKSGQASIVSRPIVPLAPERNGRLLSFSAAEPAADAKVAIDFAWQPEAAALSGGQKAAARDSAEYVLELSQSKDFETTEATRVSGLATSRELAAGTWYWRVRDGSGDLSPERKFSLDLAASPRPAFPPDGQQYSYRRAKPSVRFAWTAMNEASSYLFELASEPSFAKPVARLRTTTPSFAVDSLGEGLWYWRVSPVHAFTIVGEAPTAQARRFAIAKSPEMQAPSVTAPVDGSLYQIQDIGGNGLDFSWVPEAEAVSYEVVVSKAKDLSSPIATIATKQSYLRLSGEEASPLKRAGDYYWGLRSLDKEGNASPASLGRSLRGIDGSIAVRLSFPPDGYRVADSLITGTRFAWKSNVPTRTAFQLARDSGFEDVAYQESVSADTLIGRAWKTGGYYWRLRTYNADGSVFLETPPRSLEVVEPFAAPSLLKPAAGSNFYLREHDSASFSWTPVAHADYYTLTLRSAADGYAKPVFEKGFVESASLAYALGELPSGAYKLSVQAFAASSERTTRIIGYIGENAFNYKRVSPIQLASPAEGEHLNGLDARKGKALFAYNIEDRPDEAEVLVSTDSAGSKVVARSSDRSGRAGVGRLDPGTYYWTVAGRISGIDVSAVERVRFQVDPPPPPEPPAIKAPLEGSMFRIQGVAAQGLGFSWEAEEDAATYELVLSRSKDLSAPFARISTTQSALRLSESQAETMKRAGAYYWGLRWTNKDGDVSKQSLGRALLGVDGADALRPVFPPEGYRISEGLVGKTSFAWKSKVPARVVFQAARDSTFKDLVHQETASADNLAVRDEWKGGRYFWRLRMLNVDDSVFLETEPRGFDVVEPFAAPALLKPAPGSSFPLREGDQATFSWTPVEKADYYAVSLRFASDDYSSVLFERDKVQDASLTYALGDLPSGSYRISIQAFAAPSEQSTRIVGKIGSSGFTYRQLAYVRLARPSDGASLPGLKLRREGEAFSFETRETLDSAEILILGDPSGKTILRNVPAKSGSALIKGLAPGKYYWTVKGSSAGFDLSARERYCFEIETPPPLPAAEPVLPAPLAVFGPAQLREKRSILLSWKPVAGATHYRLRLYAQGKKEPVFVKDKLDSTSYSLEDLSVLERGQISWSVEARSYDLSGELEQGGLESKSSFTIDLPAVKKAKTSGEKKTYGR